MRKHDLAAKETLRASQGLTNREIAQTLFVTTRTVEGHLTSIYRKLRLDSRNELSAALHSARANLDTTQDFV